MDALNAGLNIPDIDSAICVAGVSTELTQTQQIGRLLRKSTPNKVAMFINLYSTNSIEESWVRKKSINLANVK